MTFSICAREPYRGDSGEIHYRFGTAVTTRLPGVGTLCPFVSEYGAIATQSVVNVELGKKGIAYLEDGLEIQDALTALLNTDEGKEERQIHGVDRNGSYVFTGSNCRNWCGHYDGHSFTIAGNFLTDEGVLEAVKNTYIERSPVAVGPDQVGTREPFAKRLIDALDAGHAAGGDKRTELQIQSAALKIGTTETYSFDPAFHDLRVDATKTPIMDLRETYKLAVAGHSTLLNRYEDTYESDSKAGR